MDASEEQVRLMLSELEKRLRDDWGGILKTKSDEIATQFDEHVNEIAAHRAEMIDQRQRIGDLINDNNAKMGEVVNEMLKHRSEMSAHETVITEQNAQMKKHEEVIVAQATRATQALNETQELDRRMGTLTTGMAKHAGTATELFQQVDGLIAKTRAETQEAFVKMQRSVELMVDGAKAQIGSGNTHGGEGQGGGGSGGKDTDVDKKESAVCKMPEQLDKMALRHWVDVVICSSKWFTGLNMRILL